jgi:transcription elongation factor GreA-like protein
MIVRYNMLLCVVLPTEPWQMWLRKLKKQAHWQTAVVRKMTKTFYRPTQHMIHFMRLFYKFTARRNNFLKRYTINIG